MEEASSGQAFALVDVGELGPWFDRAASGRRSARRALDRGVLRAQAFAMNERLMVKKRARESGNKGHCATARCQVVRVELVHVDGQGAVAELR